MNNYDALGDGNTKIQETQSLPSGNSKPKAAIKKTAFLKRNKIILPYRRITINKCRRNKGNRKAKLDSNGCRQHPLMDAKISRWEFEDKKGITNSQSISFQVFNNCKCKNNIIVVKPGRHHLNQEIKINITSSETDRCHPPLIGCSGKNTSPW